MNKNAYEHFSMSVDDYDVSADKVVINNSELQGKIIESTRILDPANVLRILDLGCGTGHTMEILLKKFPHAEVVGIDFSKRMIQNSQKKLEQHKNRITLIEGDILNADFGKGYDLIISAMTIHNIDHKSKEILFEKIFSALNVCGVFINGDFIAGESDFIDSEYLKIYETYLRSNLNGKELDVWLHHAFNDDNPMKLSEQFEILSKIGFKENTLIWQLNNEAAYFARK